MKLLYNNRSNSDQEFIKYVCNNILASFKLSDIYGKSTDDTFCGIYIEGRNREINCLEDIASLASFKAFSKYNYPIFCFIHNDNNFFNKTGDLLNNLLKSWRIKIIKIPAINSLDEYTNFCVKELYHLIPKNIQYAVTLQPDAMLLKSSWEDEVLKNNWVYIGSPWQHAPAIEYLDIDEKWKDFLGPVRIGNGGFSVRNIDFCRAASTYYGKMRLREKHTESKIPPEDLFYSVLAKYLTINNPRIEQADNFCCDPLTPEKYKSGKYFGFHYFSNE